MQKRYLIKLSDKNEKVRVDDKTELNLRELETGILQVLFEFSANASKDRKTINKSLDSAGRVENLTDTEDLIVDEEDLKFIETGLGEITGSRRPYSWTKARNLFKQLADPQELEEEKENAEES